ncbi:YT521-B-like domain-containing protein [Cercophora samala]|uniref:YT521-B-like domain-containing protein n=1 Tax=Cercophora samala TaxID=330535 RepID=A0AA39ZJ78_9PEZI|nr:YT521-B-like domain-containing protein [Cercophora samala]
MSSQPADLSSLDARTAALREKLSRSRRQNSTATPKESTNGSLGATDDDIQDLITSIRVTSGVNDDNPQPSLSSSEAFSRNHQAHAANSMVCASQNEASLSISQHHASANSMTTNHHRLPNSQQALTTKTTPSTGSQAYTANIEASPSASQAIQELLERAPDIKDWLELTDYYNTEVRTVQLDRFRRLRDLAAKKKRLEEEERKLLEEAENDSWPRQAQNKAPPAPLITRVQSVSETRQSLPTPITPNKPEPEGKETDGTVFAASSTIFTATKRAHPEEGADKQGRDKLARANLQDVQRETHHKVDGSRHLEYADSRPSHPRHDIGRPPPRRHSYKELPDFQRSRSPPRGPSFRREYGDDQPQSRYDSYKGHRDSTHLDRENGRSRRLDFGRRGDTRFFIVKSFNEQNVKQCMEDNIWTTQAKNSATFTEAFKQCKNVILFFSINQSGHFQGYARMTSAPSRKIPSPWWMKSLPWGTSEPFRLEWLSTTPLEFGRVRRMTNPLNEGLPVFVGKDGQEIEISVGHDLLNEMDSERERKWEGEHRGRLVSDFQRDEDYHHGAMVKRESST